ncbi:MAG: S8 family serine peptidase [bacterium]|nr:MAG: S8 family serine peptidase [bacterium]
MKNSNTIYSDNKGFARFQNGALNEFSKKFQLVYQGDIFDNRLPNLQSRFQNIIRVTIKDQLDWQPLVNTLNKYPDVIWAEYNHPYSLHFIPNDSLFPQQWALAEIRMENAWDVEQGDTAIIVGVIDTGIDYNHEDIEGQLWVNQLEDLNQNGKLDSLDLNGIDDDQNGYIDDVIGWDFTHAPAFPDQGDYLTPDNDPMDDYPGGHGTPVAGIINAATHNVLGIAGTAPGIRVMALRAGTASGYLEEDDVAEAIIYAVQNGCRIINMSFGDLAYSHLLKEAVDYGTSQGVIFVASAGNSGNQVLQFPAGYDNTLAVGATDSNTQLAPFSNYGSKLDLVAPGQDILSTGTQNYYGNYSGTSFAAPMVCGVLGLLWSQQPSALSEHLIGQLLAGCTDLGMPGWDIYYGHGILNASTALNSFQTSRARIDSPPTYSGVKDPFVAILGTAAGSNFKKYTLSVGGGENPIQMIPFVESTTQVISDTLGIWDTGALIDSVYTIQLKITDWQNSTFIHRAVVFLDRTPPVLQQLDIIPILVKDKNGFLIEVYTDDQTRSTLFFRNKGSSLFNGSIISSYLGTRHTFLLTQERSTQKIDFYLSLENNAGLMTIDDNLGQFYELDLSKNLPLSALFEEITALDGFGYLMTPSIDINGDGILDVIGNIQQPGQQSASIGSINLINENLIIYQGIQPAFGRDIYDINFDGIPELLAGFGNKSYLYPGQNLPQFTGNPLQFSLTDLWAARMTDLFSDGNTELLALHLGEWNIFRLDNPADLTLTQLQILMNPTDGENNYGVPYAEIRDLNQSGQPEIILGDYDGDIIIYEEQSGNRYEPLTFLKLPGQDATHRFAVGDVDGDSQAEIIVATQRLADYDGESSSLGQYWIVNILKLNSNGILETVWKQNFHGIVDLREAYSGISLADYDQDGREEIFFTPYPQAYYIQFEDNMYQVNWYFEGINAAAVPLVAENQILMTTPTKLIVMRNMITADRPQAPSRLRAESADTAHIELKWEEVWGADYYLLLRETLSLQLPDSFICQTVTYQDTMILSEEKYRYTVRAVDSSFVNPVSGNSNALLIRAENTPQLVNLEVIQNKQLLLNFDRPLDPRSMDVKKYIVSPGSLYPSSAVRAQGGNQILLGFQTGLAAGEYELQISELYNQYGVPFYKDTLTIHFEVLSSRRKPYVEKVVMKSKKELLVVFSHPMDPVSVRNLDYYQLEPDDEVTDVFLEPDNPENLCLTLSGRNRMGSLGVNYYLKIGDLKDIWGESLSEEGGNRHLIRREVENLNEIVVFPNPLRAGLSEEKITFGNLPLGCEISIYTANGELVEQMKNENSAGGMVWELNNQSGRRILNGVYLYVASYQGQQKTGKFVVLR